MEKEKNLHFKKTNNKRIVIMCDYEFPFHTRFSKMVANQLWKSMSLTDDHTCHGTFKNRQTKIEWLAKRFTLVLRHTPKMRPMGLISKSLDKWGVKISSAQAYTAKTRTLLCNICVVGLSSALLCNICVVGLCCNWYMICAMLDCVVNGMWYVQCWIVL